MKVHNIGGSEAAQRASFSPGHGAMQKVRKRMRKRWRFDRFTVICICLIVVGAVAAYAALIWGTPR